MVLTIVQYSVYDTEFFSGRFEADAETKMEILEMFDLFIGEARKQNQFFPIRKKCFKKSRIEHVIKTLS